MTKEKSSQTFKMQPFKKIVNAGSWWSNILKTARPCRICFLRAWLFVFQVTTVWLVQTKHYWSRSNFLVDFFYFFCLVKGKFHSSINLILQKTGTIIHQKIPEESKRIIRGGNRFFSKGAGSCHAIFHAQ